MSGLFARVRAELKPRIGTRRRRLETHPLRTRRQRDRLASTSKAGRRSLVEAVDTRISPHDAMYVGDGEHYFSVGLSAIEAVEGAITAAATDAPERILDMPCGHGRVLRFLARRFPDAELASCDLDAGGVRFCAQRFGAAPVESSLDLRRLSLPGPFDLIWCGSLATHLAAEDVHQLLTLFSEALAPRGLAVVTTHGASVADALRSEAADYQLEPDAVRTVLNDYDATGFGYADYPWSPGYGVSVSSRAWTEEAAAKAGLRVARFEERSWDGHQDVVALVPA